jgi:hypothetical protein
MENALRVNPQDSREQYVKQLKDLQEAYGEAMLELRARKWIAVPAGRGREKIVAIRKVLREDRVDVPISRLCRRCDVPRRTVYYGPTKKGLMVQERFEAPIKPMIEENPWFGYRTVADLLRFNRTRCNGSASSSTGTFANVRSAPGLVCGRSPRSRPRRMNAGRRTRAGSGVAGTAGRAGPRHRLLQSRAAGLASVTQRKI